MRSELPAIRDGMVSYNRFPDEKGTERFVTTDPDG